MIKELSDLKPSFVTPTLPIRRQGVRETIHWYDISSDRTSDWGTMDIRQ